MVDSEYHREQAKKLTDLAASASTPKEAIKFRLLALEHMSRAGQSNDNGPDLPNPEKHAP